MIERGREREGVVVLRVIDPTRIGISWPIVPSTKPQV